MKILGIHSGVTHHQHDPGAALICDGKLISVCEEERFLRVKTPKATLPIYSIQACLAQAGLKLSDIDLIVHPGESYEDMPERIRLYCQHYFGSTPPVKMINHQLAHMASAFFCSGYDKSMVMSYDAVGDRISVAYGLADRKNGVTIQHTRGKEQSLGLFYAVLTSYLGFQTNEDEYKVMGLAAHGEPGVDLSPIIRVREDDYEINSDFFVRNPPQSTVYEPYYNERLIQLLGPARLLSEAISKRHKDIAHATQVALEKSAMALVRRMYGEMKVDSLCLAGGVALNCSANLAISRLPFLKKLYVQPAASDRGLPLGCALQAAFEQGEPMFGLDHVYMGPIYSGDQVERTLELTGAKWKKVSNPAEVAASMLAEGKILGLWQGRSEFGPRALGNRSILADPRTSAMRDHVNTKIKFREEFRPFAPSVLEEQACDLFEMKGPSPFMTSAFPVRESWKGKLGAVTHVNGTARVQTVSKATNPFYHALISEFGAATGVPAVLNTSFNVRGQPIVESPIDALGTFYGSGMDALFFEDRLLLK